MKYAKLLFRTFLNGRFEIAESRFSTLWNLLIILPHSELRKLRRQTMRIERRPIHHSRGRAPLVGRWDSFAFELVKVDSIPITVSRSLYDRNNLSNSWRTIPITVAITGATNHLACERGTRRRWIYRFRLKNPTAGGSNAIIFFISLTRGRTEGRCPNDSSRASSRSDRLIIHIILS